LPTPGKPQRGFHPRDTIARLIAGIAKRDEFFRDLPARRIGAQEDILLLPGYSLCRISSGNSRQVIGMPLIVFTRRKYHDSVPAAFGSECRPP
jgi:hypothetical protein